MQSHSPKSDMRDQQDSAAAPVDLLRELPPLWRDADAEDRPNNTGMATVSDCVVLPTPGEGVPNARLRHGAEFLFVSPTKPRSHYIDRFGLSFGT